jgi:hypothetical protein
MEQARDVASGRGAAEILPLRSLGTVVHVDHPSPARAG